LGDHYGAALALDDPFNCLDVGPTADASATTLPQTDNQVQFEDMMIFALNYGQVSLAPPSPAAALESPYLELQVTAASPRELRAVLFLRGNESSTKGVHAVIGFDPTAVQVQEVLPGRLVSGASFFKALPEARGLTVDLAQLGVGAALPGSGELAVLRFRARDAQAAPRLVEQVLRGVRNEPVGAGARDRGAAAVQPGTPEITAGAGEAVDVLLLPARPNPFTGSTSIDFVLQRAVRVELRVFDAAGRLVRALASSEFAAGRHEISWDGRDAEGSRVSPGVYFCSLSTGAGEAARKLIVVE